MRTNLLICLLLLATIGRAQEYVVPADAPANLQLAAQQGESLKLRIIALDRKPVTSVTVHYRPMGRGNWRKLPATHVARAVYEAVLPPAHEDFEYYIASANQFVWPATAPRLNHTVIVTEIRNLRRMQPLGFGLSHSQPSS